MNTEANDQLDYTLDLITWWETNPFEELKETSKILEDELARIKGEDNV